MDTTALDGLRDETIDWRFKGFPASLEGLSIGRLAERKAPLGDFSTPLLTLDAAALEHNIATMARFCAEQGVDLAPHGKTTMAPQLFARQLEAGAWGITAATITHVRVYRAFGVPTILMGNQLVDPRGLAWVARQLNADAGFRFMCFVDSVEGVEAMQAALAGVEVDPGAGPAAFRPIEVILDLGAQHRCELDREPGCLRELVSAPADKAARGLLQVFALALVSGLAVFCEQAAGLLVADVVDPPDLVEDSQQPIADIALERRRSHVLAAAEDVLAGGPQPRRRLRLGLLDVVDGIFTDLLLAFHAMPTLSRRLGPRHQAKPVLAPNSWTFRPR